MTKTEKIITKTDPDLSECFICGKIIDLRWPAPLSPFKPKITLREWFGRSTVLCSKLCAERYFSTLVLKKSNIYPVAVKYSTGTKHF